MFIGKGGYWEGRAGAREGWFPCAAIKEVQASVAGDDHTPPTPPPPSTTAELGYSTITRQSPMGNSTAYPVQHAQPSSSGRDIDIRYRSL